MSGQRARSNAMERNNTKRGVTQTWIPVPTRANLAEEGRTKDHVTAKLDNKLQHNDVHRSASSSISNAGQQKKASTVSYGNKARGQEESSLSVEKHSLKTIVNSPKVDFTHFISLPLALYPELVAKLVDFQNRVLGSSNPSINAGLGIDQSIFSNPKSLHLTVLMLRLRDKERVDAALKALKNVSSKVWDALDNRPVYIGLKGLETMNDAKERAHVLYAVVEEIGSEGRLLRACKVITDAFVKAGLVLEEDLKRELKLHVTVMNVSFRKPRRSYSDSFDARGIIEQFGSLDLGAYLLREAHLSQRHVFDANGYYRCCGSLPFPGGTRTAGFTP